MPSKQATARAKKDKREGKSASTQAGEFVREEIEHVREGKHGARSTEQAIAIGLSEARRAGVKVPARKGAGSRKPTGHKKSRGKSAKRARAPSKTPRKTSRKRSRATSKALKREGHAAGSRKALAKHARKSARRRSASERSAAAKKAARTKGAKERSAAARKAARTRARTRKG
ncbi:MAG TPA: DUF6496 domain-containing protein [Rhodanobacteraceae bacterium]|nr:DUF6496 domain-containing protein [Rhodanobacteraceae bacterium]